ncbi:flotillin-1 [Trichonephila clavata]|uniref:Flotillin-1 n=1 Tax=Trichonephila clavata TaxID=2740835 RepID=A0A8X6I7A5_TRICU|nr:flotillin-1 [Trichonephila clavata]
MKPENIECTSYNDLLKVDVTNPEFHLPSNVIFTGAEASALLKKLSKNHPIAKEFQISLMKAYTNTAQHMKQKLPLKSSYLISFTALDPELRGKTSTILAFEKLSSFMSHIFSDNEKSKVEAEIRLYQSDIYITKEMLYTSDESGNQVKCTIDKYWSKVFNLKDDFTNDYKYPTLAKLVKACLRCFHGPLVESAFNLMDTLVTDYRTSLKIDSLDAVQTIKYDLMASKETSCEKYGSKNPMTYPIHKDLLLNMNRSWKTYQEDLKTCISDESPIKVSEKPSTLAEKQTASTSACAVLEEISSTEALAEEERMAARYVNDTEIAKAQRDFELKKAAYDMEVNTKKAESDLAFNLQAAKTRQKIKEEQMQVKVIERAQEIQVQEQEILRKEKELEATIRRPAEAEKYRLEKLAEANRNRVIMEAEAEAEAIRLRGEAEAFAVEAKAKAEAEQMAKKADAFKEYREAAMVDMVLDTLPKIAAEVAAPLTQCNKVVMVSDGKSDIGAARLTGEVLDIIAKVPHVVTKLTGVNITNKILVQ